MACVLAEVLVHAGTFSLTEASGKPFTEKNVKKEFAVLLFGALDHPKFRRHMDQFAKALYESDEVWWRL